MLDDENNKAEWNQIMARLTDFAQETARGLESRYNETVWFPAAYNAVMQYMEVRTICCPYCSSVLMFLY